MYLHVRLLRTPAAHDTLVIPGGSSSPQPNQSALPRSCEWLDKRQPSPPAGSAPPTLRSRPCGPAGGQAAPTSGWTAQMRSSDVASHRHRPPPLLSPLPLPQLQAPSGSPAAGRPCTVPLLLPAEGPHSWCGCTVIAVRQCSAHAVWPTCANLIQGSNLRQLRWLGSSAPLGSSGSAQASKGAGTVF